jgi:hypothetical protein
MADPADKPKRGPRTRSMQVSMADIARLANVSKPTVSRVLNGSPLVTEATREHVMNIARQHGYAVNRNAQKLRQTRTNTVSVVLDFGSHRGGRIADPFVFELLAGVAEALSVRNVELMLSLPWPMIRAPIRTRSPRAWSMASSFWARVSVTRCCAAWARWACPLWSGARWTRPNPIARWDPTIGWAARWRGAIS